MWLRAKNTLLNRDALSQPVSDNQSDIPEYRVRRGEINVCMYVLYDLMYFCRSLACPDTSHTSDRHLGRKDYYLGYEGLSGKDFMAQIGPCA